MIELNIQTLLECCNGLKLGLSLLCILFPNRTKSQVSHIFLTDSPVEDTVLPISKLVSELLTIILNVDKQLIPILSSLPTLAYLQHPTHWEDALDIRQEQHTMDIIQTLTQYALKTESQENHPVFPILPTHRHPSISSNPQIQHLLGNQSHTICVSSNDTTTALNNHSIIHTTHDDLLIQKIGTDIHYPLQNQDVMCHDITHIKSCILEIIYVLQLMIRLLLGIQHSDYQRFATVINRPQESMTQQQIRTKKLLKSSSHFSPSVLHVISSDMDEFKILVALGVPYCLRFMYYLNEYVHYITLSNEINPMIRCDTHDPIMSHHDVKQIPIQETLLHPNVSSLSVVDKIEFQLSVSLSQISLALLSEDIFTDTIRYAAIIGLQILLTIPSGIHPSLFLIGFRKPSITGGFASKKDCTNMDQSNTIGKQKKKLYGIEGVGGYKSSGTPQHQQFTVLHTNDKSKACIDQSETNDNAFPLPTSQLCDYHISNSRFYFTCSNCHIQFRHSRESLEHGKNHTSLYMTSNKHCIGCGSTTLYQSININKKETTTQCDRDNQTHVFNEDTNCLTIQLPLITCLKQTIDSMGQRNSILNNYIYDHLTIDFIHSITCHEDETNQRGLHSLNKTELLIKNEQHIASNTNKWILPFHGWLLRLINDTKNPMLCAAVLDLLHMFFYTQESDTRSSEVRFISHLPILNTLCYPSSIILSSTLKTMLCCSRLSPLKDGAVKKICRLLQTVDIHIWASVIIDFLPRCYYHDGNSVKTCIKGMMLGHCLLHTDWSFLSNSGTYIILSCLQDIEKETSYHDNQLMDLIDFKVRCDVQGNDIDAMEHIWFIIILRCCFIAGRRHQHLLNSIYMTQPIFKIPKETTITTGNSITTIELTTNPITMPPDKAKHYQESIEVIGLLAFLLGAGLDESLCGITVSNKFKTFIFHLEVTQERRYLYVTSNQMSLDTSMMCRL